MVKNVTIYVYIIFGKNYIFLETCQVHVICAIYVYVLDTYRVIKINTQTCSYMVQEMLVKSDN